jgi:hypothetical protein
MLSESEKNIKEQLVMIWIPFWGCRQGPVPGINKHKITLAFVSNE